MNFEESLELANAQLKRDKTGVSIWNRGGTLSLRATVPPKPDSGKVKSSQQYIALGVYANPAGLRRAIAEAKRLSADLTLTRFDWANWGWTPKVEQRTVSDWVQAFERQYFSERERNGKSETTWSKDYKQPFAKLPQSARLTASLLLEGIKAKEPDSRPRQRFCDAYSALAKFAGIPLDAGKLRGNYSPKKVNPRNLPTDEEIRAWRDRIPRPDWQWVYGCVAAFGLRDHEAFLIDLETIKKSPLIYITDGKTGPHYAISCPVSWWEEWRLFEPLIPPVTARKSEDGSYRHEDYTHRCGQYFRRDMPEKMPFGLQDLRHRWAIRSSEMGIPSEFAARLQGHSHAMHTGTYQRHMDEQVFAAILKTLQSNP